MKKKKILHKEEQIIQLQLNSHQSPTHKKLKTCPAHFKIHPKLFPIISGLSHKIAGGGRFTAKRRRNQ
jgi:hypothetical protein